MTAVCKVTPEEAKEYLDLKEVEEDGETLDETIFDDRTEVVGTTDQQQAGPSGIDAILETAARGIDQEQPIDKDDRISTQLVSDNLPKCIQTRSCNIECSSRPRRFRTVSACRNAINYVDTTCCAIKFCKGVCVRDVAF